ncbi:hypothetical protein ACHHV8_27870 [Paenibacillus sp. TAB 01]|uniref:hypothetical protein n=1 Tax=Paenibacillus sp. TAB 01 TaxID=3368988 RepID=UPI003750CB41
MLGLLLSLLLVYLHTRRRGRSPDPLIRWWIQLPFSIYLGWVAVAAIVNIAVALYAVKWHTFGLSETAWTMLLLVFTFLVTAAAGVRFRDPAYVLVAVWALIAIGAANRGDVPVQYTAWGAAVLLFIGAAVLVTHNLSNTGNS